jgi:8-oxo-dGTP pyrophosphatase MutT (NUDIX family)
VVTSPSVDRSLDRPVVLAEHPYVLPPDLAAIKPEVLALDRSVPGAPSFNGLNAGLSDDLDPAGGDARLQPVRYFDTMASTYLAGDQWRTGTLAGVSADITHHLFTADGRLVPLSKNDLSNQIGVSTVALTSDGWMLLLHQGLGSRSSPGLVAPSGSGSLEPKDIIGKARLPGAVSTGMERELREELGLLTPAMRKIPLETTVLGFGRWLEKGGKPEFYGVTRIHAAMAELDVRIDESEREYVGKHEPIPPADVARLLAGDRFEALGLGAPSVPLEMCLALIVSR